MQQARAFSKLKRFFKFIAFSLGILGLLLALLLVWQIKELHDDVVLEANRISALERANLQINQTLTDLQAKANNLNDLFNQLSNGKENLQQIQAISASIALSNLQTNLAKGQSKAILITDTITINTLLNALHQSNLNLLSQQLQTALGELPNINQAAANAELSTLLQELATLNFNTSISESAATNVNDQQHSEPGFLGAIWQQIKGLVVVRSDNQIGAQLVSDSARFDALRMLQLLIQEAKWQILSGQDPSATLTQLKITVSAYTAADAMQASWLNQLAALQNGSNFYPSMQVQNIFALINKLQVLLNTI